jgi:preprotein translocase subunit SecA
MNRFNLPDDVPIEAGMVTKAIRSAQTQVEQQNFEIRKNVLKYDEVLNKQRTVIYDERRRVLAGEDIGEQIQHMLGDVVNAYVDGATAEGYAEDWDLAKLWTALRQLYPITLDRTQLTDGEHADDLTRDTLAAALLADAQAAYAAREAEIDQVIGAQGGMRELERQVLLQVMDRKWREHLYEMDYLKEGIGLRAMAQRDPLIEYQREGFDMFTAMLEGIKEETVTHLFTVRVQAVPQAAAQPPAAQPPAAQPPAAQPAPADESATRTQPNPVVAPAAERVTRTPVPAGNRGGRHAAPERDPAADPAATTGVLPTVFGGNGPRRAAELQYSGPSEDGGTTRSRSGGGTPGAGGRAARGGGSTAEPARNRPCPCGSGRKYKHCHGAPTAAHS